jgi:hypothetical protein
MTTTTRAGALAFVPGPEPRYHREVAGAERGEGYHPDYRRLAT